jgi:hypothetical protein
MNLSRDRLILELELAITIYISLHILLQRVNSQTMLYCVNTVFLINIVKIYIRIYHLIFIYFDLPRPHSRIPINPMQYEVHPTRIHRTRRLRETCFSRCARVYCSYVSDLSPYQIPATGPLL